MKVMGSVPKAARLIASRDLTLEKITVKNRDEVGELADSFNEMVMNLRQLIDQAKTNAEQVAAFSEELSASTEHTSKAIDQISSSTHRVAEGTFTQVQRVNESVQAINEMSAGAQQIAENAQSVSSSAFEAEDKSKEGNQALQKVIEQMSFIQQSIENLPGVIKVLGERSQDIGEIVRMISGIAAQTNLLSLDASIEAARAGEHGRGFAIVAGEIRSLADQSSKSSHEIAELISSIQQETNAATQSMAVGTNEVIEGIRVVHLAGRSFEQIQTSIQHVVVQIQEVASASQQMSASMEQVGSSMHIISKIVEESASGIQPSRN